jgi:hypothetical protein
VLILKIVLLVVLWLVFVRPWSTSAISGQVIGQKLYAPAAATLHHD